MVDALELSFFSELMKQENGVRKGYTNGRWYPHHSLEGGTDTIAYGHKLTSTDIESQRFKFGITQAEAVQLLLDDFSQAEKIVESDWDKYQPERWYSLDRKYQLLLSELVFNAGPLARGGKWRWPALAFAVRNDDDQQAFRQSLRWYTDPAGTKRPLLKRTIGICDSLGLIFDPTV